MALHFVSVISTFVTALRAQHVAGPEGTSNGLTCGDISGESNDGKEACLAIRTSRTWERRTGSRGGEGDRERESSRVRPSGLGAEVAAAKIAAGRGK